MIKGIIKWVNKNIAMLLFVGMIGCMGGIILSFLFQNEAIATLGYNMDESTADTILLEEETKLEYNLSFNEKLLGVQVKMTNHGKETTSGTIHYEVTSLEDGHVLGSASVSAAGFEDKSYVFLPFAGFEKCIGNLKLTIWIEGVTDGNYPSFYVNTQEIPDVNTVVNGEVQKGNLLIIYNTPIYNKPLLFDFTMLFAILFSVFVLVKKEQITNNSIIRKIRKREAVHE